MSTLRPRLLSALCLLLATGCGEEEPLPRAPAPSAEVEKPARAQVVDAGVVELARLTTVTGEVRLERGGKQAPAERGPLWRGDALETGADGGATVLFADGRTVEVGPEARFLLDEDASGVVVAVSRGFVLSRVPAERTRGKAGPRVQLTVLTPFGLTRTGSEESEVRVEVGQDEGRVEVLLGTVEVVAKNGKSVRATRGQVLSVKPEGVTTRVLELATVQVTVHAGTGRTEWRQKGSARWRGVDRDGEALKAGDSVRARQGSALLTLEGSESTLSLGPGGELVVEGVERRGSTDEARLALLKGELGLMLAPGRASRVVLPGLSLESDGAARLDVRRTGDGFTVDSRAGDVTLVRGEARESLRAGERATVAGAATARVEAVEQAPLALSSTAGQQVFHKRPSEVALTWEEAGEVRVEVASDAGFKKPVLAGVARRGFVNVMAPVKGSLYWRVRRPEGAEVARGSAFFGPERSAKGALGRLRNRVPEGPEKTTIFFQDKPPAVTFTCQAEPGAASYKVAVYRSGALGQPVAERSASAPQVPLEAGVLKEGSFVWSITPVAADGRPVRGGRMSKLELVFDNSVPTLIVNAPREGQRAGRRVRVSGVAPVDAKLFVNGRPLSLDSKHRFDTWVSSEGRPPRVVFKMSRPGAPDVYSVRTLK
ncbi:FecR domain-containing protein [Archangium violaceum]|uniref:FecR domain-containing protein n=1 Tax=Archangium violaceum TaxID=83451 RepID=UPI00193B9EEA|nr:FecR domain-containing protein [Archangium violaceum]QRK08504.1 FecR domain-containing protein [Archangium violaceum]